MTSHIRTLHGFFGPTFQTGSGPFRFFVTGKVGFENFSVTNDNATTGFTNSVGLTNGTTRFAVYPGGGVEAFAGPIGFAPKLAMISIFSMARTIICESVWDRNSAFSGNISLCFLLGGPSGPSFFLFVSSLLSHTPSSLSNSFPPVE